VTAFLCESEAEANPDLARLRAVGLAVLSDSADGASATAFDGSLATGRVWPSSDVDVTVLLPHGEDWDVQWLLRGDIVVHMHLTPAGVLERLQRGYPDSFIQTAAGDWFLDPTWFLDGLATMRPVHDPDGRLAEVSEFVRARRFAAEVVVPRRKLLLEQSAKWREAAEIALRNHQHLAADWSLSVAVDALAFAWLEAAGRTASHKELDPELAEVCSGFGRPDAHALFRAASGASQLRSCLPGVAHCFDQLLQAYLHRLNSVPLFWPQHDGSDPFLLRLYHHKHRIHSACCALERGCYMHAAGVISDVERLAAWATNAACENTSTQEMVNHVVFGIDVSTAREALLAAVRRPSLRRRLKAARDLEKLTRSQSW